MHNCEKVCSTLNQIWRCHLKMFIFVCMFSRGKAIQLPALPIPSLSEREPKDARPKCPPLTFRQQPVPRQESIDPEPGRARRTGCQPPTKTTVTTDHKDPDSFLEILRFESLTQDSWWTHWSLLNNEGSCTFDRVCVFSFVKKHFQAVAEKC